MTKNCQPSTDCIDNFSESWRHRKQRMKQPTNNGRQRNITSQISSFPFINLFAGTHFSKEELQKRNLFRSKLKSEHVFVYGCQWHCCCALCMRINASNIRRRKQEVKCEHNICRINICLSCRYLVALPFFVKTIVCSVCLYAFVNRIFSTCNWSKWNSLVCVILCSSWLQEFRFNLLDLLKWIVFMCVTYLWPELDLFEACPIRVPCIVHTNRVFRLCIEEWGCCCLVSVAYHGNVSSASAHELTLLTIQVHQLLEYIASRRSKSKMNKRETEKSFKINISQLSLL